MYHSYNLHRMWCKLSQKVNVYEASAFLRNNGANAQKISEVAI